MLISACGDDDRDSGDDAGPLGDDVVTVPAAPAVTSAPDAPTSAVGSSSPDVVTTTPRDAPAATLTTVAADVDPVVSLVEVARLSSPVDLAWRADDAGHYVVEQDGRVVRIVDDGRGGEPTVVLDITELTSANGERGLLGLAFGPEGDRAYVNYTNNDGDTVVAEYPVAADGTFDAAAARTVIEIDQPQGNHNGGDLAFGPDGLLYVGMGDGGGAGDPERRATDLSSLLGKMLRIDPTPSGDAGYTVPADNPFVGTDGARPEIWASGLRNPWRFSFDAVTGDLWIADVGQGAEEEIDVAPAVDGRDAGRGLSFGWSAFEGTARYNDDVGADGHTPPLYTYTHADGGCSVSGGVRARGGPVPALDGWFVFGDYCTGTVSALSVTGDGASIAAGRVVELGQLPSLTAVVAGPDGTLYALSKDGPVMRLAPP